MNFAGFIKSQVRNNRFATSLQYYKSLGGKDVLGVTSRYFWYVEREERKPSAKLLSRMLQHVSPSDKKTIIISFFKSIFEDPSEAAPVIEYLEKYLFPEVEKTSKSVWDSREKVLFYTEDQLDFLNKNHDALALFKHALLKDSVPRHQIQMDRKKLKTLESLGLIEIKEHIIVPTNNAFRLPSYQNSQPRAVAKAFDYVMNHVDIYASKEGSSSQQFNYAMQMVKPAVARVINQQMVSFKKWIQSFAETSNEPDLVPMLYVGFSKNLENKEL